MKIVEQKISIAIISNIKLPIDASIKEAFSVAKKKLKKHGLSATEFFVYRRSIDARRKDEICFVYSIAARGDFSKAKPNEDFTLIEPSAVTPEIGNSHLSAPPLVVGAGPCNRPADRLLLSKRSIQQNEENIQLNEVDKIPFSDV